MLIVTEDSLQLAATLYAQVLHSKKRGGDKSQQWTWAEFQRSTTIFRGYVTWKRVMIHKSLIKSRQNKYTWSCSDHSWLLTTWMLFIHCNACSNGRNIDLHQNNFAICYMLSHAMLRLSITTHQPLKISTGWFYLPQLFWRMRLKCLEVHQLADGGEQGWDQNSAVLVTGPKFPTKS